MTLPQLTADAAQLTADLDQHGYCLIDKVFSPDELQVIRATLKEVSAKHRSDDSLEPIDWERRGGDQWLLLMPGEDGLDQLWLQPRLLALAHHLLGRSLLLSGFSSHIIHPGNELMALHTDQWWLPQPETPGQPKVKAGDLTRATQPFGPPTRAARPLAPAAAINIMLAVTDFTHTTGATRLVPGSHLSGHHPNEGDEGTAIDAEIPAGSAVAWDVRTWHASGLNRAQGPRIGVTTIYCGPQFRQLQNFALALRPETHAALTEEMRALLGFKLWSSYGATDDFAAPFARPGYRR